MVVVHHPIVPTKLTYPADVGCITGHNSSGDLPGGHVNTVGRARANHCLQYNTVVPKSLGRTSSDHQSGYTSLKFPDTSSGGLHPRGVGLRPFQVAIGFPTFAFEVTDNFSQELSAIIAGGTPS